MILSPGKFHPRFFFQFDSSRLLNSNHVYWCRIIIHAPTAVNNYIIGLPAIAASGLDQGNDLADVFIINDHRIEQHYATGTLTPRSERIIKEPVNRNFFPVEIDSGGAKEIYIRLQREKHFAPLQFNFQIQHPVVAVMGSGINLLSHIIFYSGVMAILFAFGFSFLLITRQKPFLWFSLNTFTYLAHSLIIHPNNLFVQWIVPEHPVLVYYAWYVLIVMNLIFYIQFGRSFTDIRNRAKRIDILMKWVIALATVYGIGQLAFLFFAPAKNPVYFLEPVIFLMIGFVGIRLLFINDFRARWYGIATVWLFLFQSMGLLWNSGILPSSFPNPWAIAQIGSLVLIFFGLAYRFRESEKEKAEAEKALEIDKIRSRFFANISHEFRTPLTLMLGPLKQLEDGKVDAGSTKKYFRMMRHNGERLLHLINQILDLSKLESGKLELKVEKSDVTALLKSLVHSFDSMAEQKQINYHVHFPEEEIIGWLDRDKISKVVTNLLSNAFRFTPENGSVSAEVEVDEKRLRLSVQDSGTGIPKEQLDKIFDRFYQVEGTEGGTGIGLSLVKELIQLHHGQISVSCDSGKGAKFRVSIPVAREFYDDVNIGIASSEKIYSAEIREQKIYSNGNEENAEAIDALLPNVLIVEDNYELRSFISDTLKENFSVTTAENGLKGKEKALEQIPDLIVSDVMMPVMDGVAMCNELKQNEKTSHIPIIMLTAKASKESKIEGLKIGADDYLVKPFDGDELIARINNLIESRKKLRERFSKQVISIAPDEVKEESQENIFLKRVREAIEENIDNELFGVVDLANAISMSRSQLHRKLKALTGNGPNELIRNFRLERARQLLEQHAHNVTEVAFMTGFSSPAYFSKCFSDRFGVAPGELKKQKV